MTDPKPPQNKFKPGDFRSIGMLSSVGLTLVICSAIGTGLGYLADEKWKISPWGVAVGFLIGTAAGFVELFQTVMKANDDD